MLGGGSPQLLLHIREFAILPGNLNALRVEMARNPKGPSYGGVGIMGHAGQERMYAYSKVPGQPSAASAARQQHAFLHAGRWGLHLVGHDEKRRFALTWSANG